MKSLYPEIEPFHHFYLDTHLGHSVYVEQSGNPLGTPVIFLHGGPCSGTKASHRCFFNPKKYHIILFDQRGCGQSTPFGKVEQNNTQSLIEDMESIREKLGIEKWVLFGGSWGATLALLYAQAYPNKVMGMVLRGVFLARKLDMDWFVNQGAGMIYPEKWQQLISFDPERTDKDLIEALYHAVFGNDELAKRRAAKAWIEWGNQVSLMNDYKKLEKSPQITEKMVQKVQMEMHYAKNKYFIAENQVLNNCHLIQHIPTMIVHGRYDLVCPMAAGKALANQLPQAEFHVLPNAGHIASGDEMIHALVDATDRMVKKI